MYELDRDRREQSTHHGAACEDDDGSTIQALLQLLNNLLGDAAPLGQLRHRHEQGNSLAALCVELARSDQGQTGHAILQSSVSTLDGRQRAGDLLLQLAQGRAILVHKAGRLHIGRDGRTNDTSHKGRRK